MKFAIFCAIALKLLLSGSLSFSLPTMGADSTISSCKENCSSMPNVYCEPSNLTCKCRYGMLLSPWWAAIPNLRCRQSPGGVCRFSDSKTGKNIILLCVPNAECSEGENAFCECSQGYYVKNGACVAVESLGGSCSRNEQCGTDVSSGLQLTCLTGKCLCDPSNSVYASVRRNARAGGLNEKALCAPLATKQCSKGFCAPRAECSSNYNVYEHVYWNGTHLSKSAVCECKIPYKINERTLECGAPYGEICNPVIPCIAGFVCDGSSSRCGCALGQRYDTKREKCITELGGVCQGTVECIQNAICYYGRCYCKSGYVQLGTGKEATCAASYGFSCLQDSDCDKTNNLMCVGRGTKKTCACKLGLKMFQKSRKCALPNGAVCNQGTSCGDDMKCTNGICKCLGQMYFDREFGRCVKSVGDTCVYGTDCETKAFCSHGICRCDEGYVSIAGGGCAASFGTVCRLNADCAQAPNELVCRNGTCACKSGLVRTSTTKLCYLEYGSRCNGADPCMNKLVCNGTCTCPQGQYFHTDRCFSYAGEKCSAREDCTSNSNCRNQTCACKPGYVQSSEGYCRPDYGSKCFKNSDCDQSKNELRCSELKTCDCQSGLKMSNGQCSFQFEDSGTLQKEITMTSNALASTSAENSLQTEPPATTYSTTELAEISSCTASNLKSSESSNSSTALFCKNRTSDHTPCQIQPTSKSSVTKFNLTCSDDLDCFSIRKNMICTNKTCVCETGLEISETTGTCSLAHGAPCTESKFCDDGLVCNCLCSCPAGQYFSSNRCISYAGSSCSDCTDCVPNSDCFNKTCVCKDGYVQSPSGECQADFGTSCSSDVDCDQTKTNLRCSEEQTCDCQQGSTMSPTDGICYVESEVLQNSTCEDHEIGNGTCFGRDFGEPCNETTSPCLTRNLLECQNGTCVCNSNSEYNIEQETCIHLEGHGLLGNPCINQQFCTSGQCIEGICKCPPDFYSEGRIYCFPKKYFHEPCNADIECGKDNLTTSDLVCLNETCSCNPKTSIWAAVFQNDYRSENSQSMSLCAPLPNKPCFRGYCSPGAICRMHFFEYGKNGFYTSRQKSNFTMPICDCIPPLQASPKSGICSSPPGHVCNSTFSCIDTECINGTCACSQIQHFDPASKTCKTLVPHQCQLSSECTFFSECVDGVCICQSGYVPTEFGACAAKVDGKCSVDVDCNQIANKLECIQGFCRCKTGLQLNLATGICSLPYNAECTEETSNCGETFICIDGRCTCDPHTGFYNATIDRCLSKVGGSCHETHECVKRSFCYHHPSNDLGNGTCHCIPGTNETIEKFCARGHKGPCKITDDCHSDAGLLCRNFKCECPSQHKYSSEHGLCQGLVRARCSSPNKHGHVEIDPILKCVANAECKQQGLMIYKCMCSKGWKAKNSVCVRS